jgi:hypothetical protein
LALVGATLGVASMYLNWYSTSEIIGFFELRPWDMVWFRDWTLIEGYERMGSAFPLWLPQTLFIIGTIAAFMTPLGGVVQLSGISLFVYRLASVNDGNLPAEVGAYVGIISGALALVSMVYPIGLGYSRRLVSLVGRLLVFSPGEEVLESSSEKRP